jgi:hypothetical protein
MPINPFPPINYPPGTSNDPNAPWNQVDIIGDCFECGKRKLIEDMSFWEHASFDDNDDLSYLCDTCYIRKINYDY